MNELLQLNPLLFVAIIGVIALSNVAFTMIAFKRLRHEKQKSADLFKRLNEVSWDMKGLYDSSTGIAKRIQGLERTSRQLAETQEQFTLKEPTHQTYQNAIRMIKSGDSVDKISETSGLSRGEVELLSLLRKIEDGEPLRSNS